VNESARTAVVPIGWPLKWVSARLLLPLSVLLGSLFTTHELWTAARRNADQALQTTFNFRVHEYNRRIEQRMLAYEQVLRGARGLFEASSNVTRAEFRAYVNLLVLNESYPGIEGVGLAAVIPASQKEQHIAAVRKEGFPDYDIKPGGERDMYSSIVYLEPFEGRNLRAFGYDMYSEPNRRAAMEQARDTGKAVISGKVTLVQEASANAQTGVLIYLPVYRNNGNGAPVNSLEERRRRLAGWVFAPFRMDDLMLGLFGENTADLDIEIYDGNRISDETRMYDTRKDYSAASAAGASGRLTSIEHLEVAGRYWTVAMAALPRFESNMEHDRSLLILRGGISISLLLALIAYLLIDERARALQAAQQALRLALYDVLTGLPNRKLIIERLSQALAKARREKTQGALMFIDLDKFKPVNDDFGHQIGDLLLKDVAKRLHECMRETDTAARLGGDEFIVLLPRVEGQHGAMVVATKILRALNRPFEIAGNSFRISASIGVALYPDHGSDEKSLLKNADSAMYHAKNSGKNGVVFFEAGMEHGGR
jgi:diguanylate cyclase (GGDEF)-like protein